MSCFTSIILKYPKECQDELLAVVKEIVFSPKRVIQSHN